MPIRPSFNVSIAILYPFPTGPSTRSAGMRQFSSMTSHVELARIPSLCSRFPNANPGSFFLDEKRRDPFVARLRIDGREDEEEPGLGGVGDPELAAVEDVVVALGLRAALQGERVGAGAGLGEAVGGDRVRRRARQVLGLLFLRSVAVRSRC